MRTIIGTLAGVAVLATLAMLAGLKLDLRIAQLFYDPAQQRFLGGYQSLRRGRA